MILSFVFAIVLIIAGNFFSNPVFATGSINSAIGGTNISVDSITSHTYTPLTGPVLNCISTGDITSDSTITINAPTGFKFDTTPSSVGVSSNSEVTFGVGSSQFIYLTPTTNIISIPVKTGNSLTNNAQITISGIKVIPTNSNQFYNSEISVNFSAGTFGNDITSGQLSSVAGNLNHLDINSQHNNVETAGTPFYFTITAHDQFSNLTTKSTSGSLLGVSSFNLTTTATSKKGSSPLYGLNFLPKNSVNLNLSTGSTITDNFTLFNADESDPLISFNTVAVGLVGASSPSININPAANVLDWYSSFDIGPSNASVETMAVYNQKLYIGAPETNGSNVYSYDGSSWQTVYDFGTTYTSFESMAVYNNKLFVGLGENSGSGDAYSYDGTNWSLSFNGGPSIERVQALKVYNGKLYAGLGHNTGDADVYVFDGTSWTLNKDLNDFNSHYERIQNFEVYNGKLYAGMGQDLGEADIYVYDGTNWQLSGDLGPTYQAVRSLKVYNGKLYAGTGNITGTGDLFVFDGATWSLAVDFGTTNERVESLGVYDGKLYAGLGYVAGNSKIYVYDGTSWTLNKNFGVVASQVEYFANYKGSFFASLGRYGGNGDIYELSQHKASFYQQPSISSPANKGFSIQPIIRIEDAYGNLIDSFDNTNISSYSDENCLNPISGISGSVNRSAISGIVDHTTDEIRFENPFNNIYLKSSYSNGKGDCSNKINITDFIISSESSTSSVSTCNDNRPTSIPDLFQINVTNNSAKLFFTPPSETNKYFISFSEKPNAQEHGAEVILTDKGVQNFTINLLKPNTIYYFKVRGQNGCMPGDWSQILKIVTQSKKPTKSIPFYKNTFINKNIAIKKSSPLISSFPKTTNIIQTTTPTEITKKEIIKPTPTNVPPTVSIPKKRCFLWWCF